MAQPTHTILIVYGSNRRDRQGIGLARFLATQITARGHRALVADSRDIDLPLLDRMYKEYPLGTAPEPMDRMAGMIRAADGVVVVAGEYNHGIPPVLKNMLDHFLEEWFFRPAGIACYSAGRFGGVRGAMQLRMTLAELGMPTISTLLPVPGIATAVTPEGLAEAEWLPDSAARFLDDLLWWTDASARQRADHGTPF